MNNVVLTEAKLNELERFGRFLENVMIDGKTTELAPVLVALDEFYKDILKQIKA